MTTLEDVAKAAGVSRGTVSNVFNSPELVRPEVRDRVRASARALGYGGPDPKARLLVGGKVNAIGFVMGGDGALTQLFNNPYGRELMTGIATVCDEKRAGLALVSDVEGGTAWGIRNAIVDGFILDRIEHVEHIEAAKNRRLPFVVFDVDAGPDVNSVRVDYRDGARQAAAHLLSLGHRRFAIMTVLRASASALREQGGDPIFHAPGKRNRQLVHAFPADYDRLSGYADAFTAAGISIDDMPIVEAVSFNVEAATGGAAMLLDSAPEATAVLTMSDVLALALLQEARRREIVVPRDVSVIGFDDNPEAALANPPLTTVVQPIVEKGMAAARIVFEGGSPRQVVLPVQLVVRSSTAPPRA